MNIDLSTGAPPSPERTLQLAETLAEIVRVLNHQTMHHEALQYPAEADRVVRELLSAAERLPQLLGQVAGWLEAEQAAGRILPVAGDYAGRPDAAVAAARLRLDMAAAAASVLRQELGNVAALTTNLAAAETGEDGTDG